MDENLRIAVDVGGTFTDVVVAGEETGFTAGKALTTPARAWDGIRDGLEVVADQLHLSLGELLQRCTYFLYSTTRATNAIIEGTTARTAFLVTAGFPDLLLYREGGKSDPFDVTMPSPDPYVPRHLTFEVSERIDSTGNVVQVLDEAELTVALDRLSELRVEAIGVCLLWSITNPAHELRVGEMIEARMPDVPFTLSHELNPIVREYRRASGSCIDASLKPLMQEHLNTLAGDLEAAGFGGLFVIGNSIGGLSRVEEGVNSPIYLVGSGPALAPVAAGELWRHEAGGQTAADHRDLVVVDTGGTSFDVSLITEGEIRRSRDTWLGAQFSGHLTGLSSVEVLSVGAGGGSIAWIDSGGLLRVGPRSAGSVPGPACYGRGGTEATVTDAALALGYIDPANFAGGRLNLSVDAAREVIYERVAAGLNSSIEEAAAAILDVTSVDMVSAIKELTVKQGLDPRNSLLVAGGGAAGLNIVPIAVELGCAEILVPHNAGVLSAMGGHFADMITEVATTYFATSSDFEHDVVGGLLKDLELQLDEVIEESSGLGPAGVEKLFSVECRYLHQSWELEISIDGIDLQTEVGVMELVDRFHKHHQKVYSVNEPGQHVEFLRWNGRLELRLPQTRPLDELATAGETEAMPAKTGTAYFSDLGSECETPYYEAEALRAGQVIEGPAIIEEPSTTLVVYPSSRLRVTRYGNYLIAVDLNGSAQEGVIG